jgi:hypothetical protein
MKNRLVFIIIIVAYSLLSCHKDNFPYPQDSNYPTVINKLNSSVLTQMKASFAQQNKYVESSLNKFGFCAIEEINNSIESPPVLSLLTQSEAIAIVNSFASVNSAVTGVKNVADLKFSSINTDSGYSDGATYWYFRTTNQHIDTLEVMNSQIIFNIKNHELVYCVGNWYPNVYIPANFNVSADKAKSSLLNKIVGHTTIAGVPYSETISSASLSASTTRLVVLPVITGDKIELRVTWQINIPTPVYYLMYVDVMTGELIGQEETVFS